MPRIRPQKKWTHWTQKKQDRRDKMKEERIARNATKWPREKICINGIYIPIYNQE